MYLKKNHKLKSAKKIILKKRSGVSEIRNRYEQGSFEKKTGFLPNKTVLL